MSINPNKIDALVKSAVFDPDNRVKEKSQREIRELAYTEVVFPASIQGLYEAAGKGLYTGVLSGRPLEATRREFVIVCAAITRRSKRISSRDNIYLIG